MRPTLPIALSFAAIVVAAACGGGPQVAPQPNADSLAAIEAARRDSLAREQARRDSIARARQMEEEQRRRALEDSLAAARRASDEVRAALATMIHFAYDKSDIRPEDNQALDQKVAILQANPDVRIEVVGHCDERGSDEYNLALGNRRALAAKQYLIGRGISEDRIATRSMGEEQPVAMGHDESAWSQNRRDEFSITSGGTMLVKPSGM